MKCFETIVPLWQISLYEDGLPAPKEIDSQQSRSAEDHCNLLPPVKFCMKILTMVWHSIARTVLINQSGIQLVKLTHKSLL